MADIEKINREIPPLIRQYNEGSRSARLAEEIAQKFENKFVHDNDALAGIIAGRWYDKAGMTNASESVINRALEDFSLRRTPDIIARDLLAEGSLSNVVNALGITGQDPKNPDFSETHEKARDNLQNRGIKASLDGLTSKFAQAHDGMSGQAPTHMAQLDAKPLVGMNA